MKKLKNPLIYAINIFIFYFIYKWIVININCETLYKHLTSLHILDLIITVGINLIMTLLYSLRLQVILNTSFRKAWGSTNLAFALNAVLPFRMGDIARLYYTQKIYLIRPTQMAVATFIEKFFDLIALALLCIFIWTFMLNDISNYLISNNYVLILFSIICTVYICILLFKKTMQKIHTIFVKDTKIKQVLLAIHEHSKGHNIPILLSLTVLIWLANITIIYVAFNTYLQIPFSILDAITLLIILALAIAIPSAPAGIGLFEASIIFYLTKKFPIDNEIALATAIVFHLVIVLPQLITMTLILISHKLKKGTIST